MSLYTVTFESSDDGSTPPVPHQPKVTPPSTKNPYAGRNLRSRGGSKKEKDKPVVVIKEIIDANDIGQSSPQSAADNTEIQDSPKRVRGGKSSRQRTHSSVLKENATEEEKDIKIEKEPLIHFDLPEQKPTEKMMPDSDKSEISSDENSKAVSAKSDPESDSNLENRNDDDSQEAIIEEFRRRSPQRFARLDHLVEYIFKIRKDVSWKGKRIHFQLYKDRKPLFHSKIKSRTVDEVVISEGSECHYSSGTFPAVMLVGEKATSFSCRERGRFGQELLTIKIQHMAKKPRVTAVHFFGSKDTTPPYIVSRPSIQTQGGHWVLDIAHRHAVKSIKNTVLVDGENREWMIVLKKDPDTVSIDADPIISPLAVFAVAIATYLCRE